MGGRAIEKVGMKRRLGLQALAATGLSATGVRAQPAGATVEPGSGNSPAWQALSVARRLLERREEVEQQWPGLMAKLGVPGLALQLIQHGELSEAWHLGRREFGEESSEPVTAGTVFECASMSKPVFAYLLMQQVQRGRLGLDQPILDFYPERFQPPQPAQARITARMLLCHRSGLPNWRSGDENRGPLPLKFTPGEGFEYSGEGYFYLQRALEHLLGEPLQTTAERELFAPLGMSSSSFVLTPALEARRARGHGEDGKPLPWSRYERANAAYTLHTTAQDYGRFLAALLRPAPTASALLHEEWRREMLAAQTVAGDRQPLERPGRALDLPGQPAKAYWSLGWILNPMADGSRVIYHTGTNSSGFRAYCQFNPSQGSGLVFLSNSLNGHQLWQSLIKRWGDL